MVEEEEERLPAVGGSGTGPASEGREVASGGAVEGHTVAGSHLDNFEAPVL